MQRRRLFAAIAQQTRSSSLVWISTCHRGHEKAIVDNNRAGVVQGLPTYSLGHMIPGILRIYLVLSTVSLLLGEPENSRNRDQIHHAREGSHRKRRLD
jgi:hypothetical protein